MVDDNLRKKMLFEESSKSIGVAYLLWLFFGAFSAHRFYAGKTKSAVFRLLLLVIPFVGWAILTLLWLIDLFLVPSMVNEQNMKTIELLNAADGAGRSEEESPRLENELDSKRQAMLEELRATGYRKERRDDFYELYR